MHAVKEPKCYESVALYTMTHTAYKNTASQKVAISFTTRSFRKIFIYV